MPRTTPAGTPLGDDFHLYDTTLRDGAQQEGLNLSVADKLTIARQLDELGAPGPVTRAIQDSYFAAVKGEVDRHKDWNEHV